MSKASKIVVLFNVLLFISFTAFAHGDEKHDTTKQKQSKSIKVDSIETEVKVHDHQDKSIAESKSDEQKISADLDEFPNLHPLIVHFAIVLILFGAFLQLSQIVFMKKEIAWIAFITVFLGTLVAYLAGEVFHPHSHGLNEHAKMVMEQHDYWADMTINFGIISTVLQLVNLFVWQQKRWPAIVVFVILSISAYSVSQTGHYGAQLVHIEGVGPQGNFLESEGGHSH